MEKGDLKGAIPSYAKVKDKDISNGSKTIKKKRDCC
jgi:hypothetical protein